MEVQVTAYYPRERLTRGEKTVVFRLELQEVTVTRLCENDSIIVAELCSRIQQAWSATKPRTSTE